VSGYREHLFKFVESHSIEISFSERTSERRAQPGGTGRITAAACDDERDCSQGVLRRRPFRLPARSGILPYREAGPGIRDGVEAVAEVAVIQVVERGEKPQFTNFP
jgi:hypothetical protein